MTDYQTATRPVNHIAAGFPTTCDTCHKFSDTHWSAGDVQPHLVPQEPRQLRGGLLQLSHESFDYPSSAAPSATRSPRPTRSTRAAPGTSTSRRPATPATRTGGATEARRHESPPRRVSLPLWRRPSVWRRAPPPSRASTWGGSRSSASSCSTTRTDGAPVADYSEMTASVSLYSRPADDGGFEYALDARGAGYPPRAARRAFSLYAAWVGARLSGGGLRPPRRTDVAQRHRRTGRDRRGGVRGAGRSRRRRSGGSVSASSQASNRTSTRSDTSAA